MARKITELNAITIAAGADIILVHQGATDQISTLSILKTYMVDHAHDDLYYTETELTNGTVTVHYNNLTNVPSFITSTGVTYEVLDTNGDIGTGAAQVSQGNHNHDAIYYTETELTNGTAVVHYNNLTNVPSFIVATDVTYENLSANSDIGTGAAQVSQGDHTHGSIYYTETELDTGQLDNRYYTETEIDATFLPLTGGTISTNLVVTGNLTVSGTTTTIDTETVQVTDNLLVVNYGEVGAGVTLGSAGLQIDRGSADDYFLQFDETSDTFQIGVAASLQAVATREASPTSNAIPFWNDTAKRLDSSSVTVSGSTLTGSLTGLASSATTAAALTGSQATAIGSNTTHRGSNGSDHSIVGTNTSAIGLNTTHRGDNSQAHTDYLINNGSDSTSGTLTAAGFSGPLTGLASSATTAAALTGSQATAITDNTTHRGDNSQAHTDYLKNNAVDIGVGLTLTGDNSSADTAYVPMILYGTDSSPPAASGFPIGTLYFEYTP